VNIVKVTDAVFVKHDFNVMLSEIVLEKHIFTILLIWSGVQRDTNCTVDTKSLFHLAMKKSKYFLWQCTINNNENCVLHNGIFKITNSVLRSVLKSPKIRNNNIQNIKTILYIWNTTVCVQSRRAIWKRAFSNMDPLCINMAKYPNFSTTFRGSK